ncbi:MAG: hypothetical protein K6T75_04025 [Acetobacteraceae bacterium]|nr:hypothetical protein [Acetobacteraceae bacterium]
MHLTSKTPATFGVIPLQSCGAVCMNTCTGTCYGGCYTTCQSVCAANCSWGGM